MGLGSCLYWLNSARLLGQRKQTPNCDFATPYFNVKAPTDGFQNLRPATNDTQKKTVKNDGELLRFQFAQWLGGNWFYLHDGKPKEFLNSTLSGTWTKRSFERFSARQPKKDNHPASDSSSLNNRRMLLLGSIGTFFSWSYIRAKTIIGIQQPIQPAEPVRTFQKGKYLWFGKGICPRICWRSSPINLQQHHNKHLNSTKSKEPTANKEHTTNNRQQTTAATSTLRMQNTIRLYTGIQQPWSGHSSARSIL